MPQPEGFREVAKRAVDHFGEILLPLKEQLVIRDKIEFAPMMSIVPVQSEQKHVEVFPKLVQKVEPETLEPEFVPQPEQIITSSSRLVATSGDGEEKNYLL